MEKLRLLVELGIGLFKAEHLNLRKVEGKARFRALVFIEMVLQESVTTTSCGGIVDGKPQVVAPKEPLEATSRGLAPLRITRDQKCFHTSRDHGVCLQGLLVEVRPLAVSAPESIATDGRKMTVWCRLDFHQPPERSESYVEDFPLRGPVSAQDEGVGEFGIVIGGDAFKPGPILCRVGAIEFDQKSRELVSHSGHHTVAGERAKVFMDSYQGKGPCPWRSEISDTGETALKKQRTERAVARIF